MKIATIIARSLLGLIFVTFGLNMFLNFIPIPPPPEGAARVGCRHALTDQQDRRRDGEEAEDRQRERGIAGRERERTEGHEPREAAAAHSTTSRPSSTDR